MKHTPIPLFLLALALAGCATLGGSPEAGVSDTIDDWAEALLAKDIDAVMETYSEDFRGYDYSDKATVAGYLDERKYMGDLDGMDIDLSAVEITVDGDTAKAGPIGVSGYSFDITIHFDLANEDGEWRLVGQEIFGM